MCRCAETQIHVPKPTAYKHGAGIYLCTHTHIHKSRIFAHTTMQSHLHNSHSIYGRNEFKKASAMAKSQLVIFIQFFSMFPFKMFHLTVPGDCLEEFFPRLLSYRHNILAFDVGGCGRNVNTVKIANWCAPGRCGFVIRYSLFYVCPLTDKMNNEIKLTSAIS